LRQLYIDGNHKRRVASVGNKGKWQLYKASCLNRRHIAVTMRQVAVTCRCGISVVRNFKFLTPSFIFLRIINIILSTNRNYVISPCDTNINKVTFFIIFYIYAIFKLLLLLWSLFKYFPILKSLVWPLLLSSLSLKSLVLGLL
jgi:hypothetical protein